jgi:predicted P-loop ATPase
MKKSQVSYYENAFTKDKKEIDLENYCGMIKHGAWQDLVLKARASKQSGDLDNYKKIKSKAQAITGSAIMKDGSRSDNNIKEFNGFIVIDIDGQVNEDLKNDKYSAIVHRSFGGDGMAIFVRINPDKFLDSFNGLAQYYLENYNITIDPSCKNPSRLRYISYDPDIYVNEKSLKFIAKDVKRFEAPKNTNFIYTKSDFDNILEQIKERQIDLCQENYQRYFNIGLALFDKFGSSGEETFHFICQFGNKYKREDASKKWANICKTAQGKVKIGTFYYYCKDAGINIYSEKTKNIINRVKISKSQGNPTIESVSKNLLTVNEITVNDEDIDLIKELIESKIDYSKEVNSDVTEIEQLENFILDTYEPRLDAITNTTYLLNDIILTDTEVNDMYLSAKKIFDFNVPINDIRSIINSNKVKRINILTDFLEANKSNPTGIIEQYAKCIFPQSDYNVWAIKKWLVGALHNWTSSHNEKLVCPLTLVLTGQQHGTGKTSFLRNIMPKELSKYIVESKINGHDKDSMYTLCNSLLVLDDEFGGKAFKDVKEYKAISDMNIITQRRPYEREAKTFKRRAILCGTSNEVDILKDVTGNRRILPINVEKIDYNRVLEIDKTSLIIEAYNLLQSGFEWIVRTQDDMDYIQKNSTQNETVLPIEEIFWKHFSIQHTPEHNFEKVWNQGEILEHLNLKSILKPTKYELKEVLIKNKLDYKLYKRNNTFKKGIALWSTEGINEIINESEPF